MTITGCELAVRLIISFLMLGGRRMIRIATVILSLILARITITVCWKSQTPASSTFSWVSLVRPHTHTHHHVNLCTVFEGNADRHHYETYAKAKKHGKMLHIDNGKR